MPTSHGMSYTSRPGQQMVQPMSMDSQTLSQHFHATSVLSNASDNSVGRVHASPVIVVACNMSMSIRAVWSLRYAQNAQHC